MSVTPAAEPVCTISTTSPVATVIDSRERDLGGFFVRRTLPSAARRRVGPFTFFDHFGPAVFEPGAGMTVRPHPHIGLATVTYLFEGEIVHRDSLGSLQAIRPGDINWMTAGRGIVHSERTSPELRATGSRLHGLQLWVGLPTAEEEHEPSFRHHPGRTIPEANQGGVQIRVLAGSAFGLTSPVESLSPLFYVDVTMPAGAELDVPDDYEERALYIAEGAIVCGEERGEVGKMFVFRRGGSVSVRALRPSRIALVGGAPLDGERYIDWNFVSSSKERIATAARDWKEGRFPKVPGDEVEFIPLPEISSGR